MKFCPKCGIVKPLEDFNKHKASPDGVHGYCRDCSRAYNREWNKKTVARNLAYVKEIKKSLACAECGYNKHPAALDFHHIDPATKDVGISEMRHIPYSLRRIDEEIAKCEVLCANCHRIRSFPDA